MKPIIEVLNLSKSYTIGERASYGSLREEIMQALTAPFKRNAQSAMHGAKDVNRSAKSDTTLWALKDVSFSVNEGEVVGIIGRNGAGKSTLLKILSRITEPTSGRIIMKGRVASLLEVGTGFHPELTGRENIFLNGALLGMSSVEIKSKFDEIVAFSEIEKFLDTPVKRYSSGMYVRLAFAVAAHLEPEILIIDEVLAVGDAQFQKKCLGKMEDAAKQGRTVLFVSHNMAAVQRLCNSGILLGHGKIIKKGTVPEVVNAYVDSGIAASYFWEREASPSSDVAYIQKICFVDQKGEPITSVETGGQLRIKFEFVIVNPCPSLQVAVCLLDECGEQIFGSVPHDDGVNVPDEAGQYNAVIEFPQDMLLARSYGLKVFLYSPLIGVFDVVDSIRFLPIETASLANSILGGRTGILALRCNWHLERVFNMSKTT